MPEDRFSHDASHVIKALNVRMAGRLQPPHSINIAVVTWYIEILEQTETHYYLLQHTYVFSYNCFSFVLYMKVINTVSKS